MKNMKGKSEFSEYDINQIRKLISDKQSASKKEEVKIRKKIRSLGFYISNYSSKGEFSIQDFDNLISAGEIRIVATKHEEKIDSDVENELIVNGNFCSIEELDQEILNSFGFYCIKLKASSRLPNRYQKILDKRAYKYIYIGKAEDQTLRDRLNQELESIGPGTFFRSIGCALDYLPIKGHLKGNVYQNNFRFSKDDKSTILGWLKNNIDVSIVEYTGDFSIEKKLIKRYCPLLNYTHNPMKLQELIDDKDRCRKYARE